MPARIHRKALASVSLSFDINEVWPTVDLADSVEEDFATFGLLPYNELSRVTKPSSFLGFFKSDYIDVNVIKGNLIHFACII